MLPFFFFLFQQGVAVILERDMKKKKILFFFLRGTKKKNNPESRAGRDQEPVRALLSGVPHLAGTRHPAALAFLLSGGVIAV